MTYDPELDDEPTEPDIREEIPPVRCRACGVQTDAPVPEHSWICGDCRDLGWTLEDLEGL